MSHASHIAPTGVTFGHWGGKIEEWGVSHEVHGMGCLA
jgi:hypothetical protein